MISRCSSTDGGTTWYPIKTDANGNVFTVPASEGSAVIGYTEQTGLKFTDSKTIGKVLPSQSFYPVRYFIQDREATLEFTLLQWSLETVVLAFGGSQGAQSINRGSDEIGAQGERGAARFKVRALFRAMGVDGAHVHFKYARHMRRGMQQALHHVFGDSLTDRGMRDDTPGAAYI